MAENTAIEWCDHTMNPWRGCTKVSPGCANCYAETMSGRNPGVLGVWGPHGTRVVASEAMWKEPIKWNRMAACCCRKESADFEHEAGCPQRNRPRVFCASLADVFEDWDGPMFGSKGMPLYFQIKDDWRHVIPEDIAKSRPGLERVTMDDVRRRLFHLFAATPNLDKLVLTKRPENIVPFIERIVGLDWWKENCAPTTWLGCTVENQTQADKRIPELLKCRDLASVLFLSCEPLLELVDISQFIYDCWTGPNAAIHGGQPKIRDGIWVIAGGESGPKARPSHPDWFRSLRDQCVAANVPLLVKQWGEWIPGTNFSRDEGNYNETAIGTFPQSKYPTHFWEDDSSPEEVVSVRVGKRAAGRLLDGVLWDQFPEVST